MSETDIREREKNTRNILDQICALGDYVGYFILNYSRIYTDCVDVFQILFFSFSLRMKNIQNKKQKIPNKNEGYLSIFLFSLN